MNLTGFGRRLWRDTSGQVLLLGAIVIVALLVFMLAIPNGTKVATQKMRTQTAADAGGFTSSVWLARGLNLSANMNIGIRSMYTWMTVLTMGSALAKALATDSLDASVQQISYDMSMALFGDGDAEYVSQYIYPVSIQRLDETGIWLQSLQDDIAGSFPLVAQTMGQMEARANASGGNPASTNPGGEVLVRTFGDTLASGDSLPLTATPAGDSLLLHDLYDVAMSLESIPTGDENIGPATGYIKIDTSSFDIYAYYGDSSYWLTLTQIIIGTFRVTQWYDQYDDHPVPGVAPESTRRFFDEHKPWQYIDYCGFSVTGQLTEWIDPTKQSWYAYGKAGYNTPKPGDSIVAHIRHWKLASDSTWPDDTGTAPVETIPWIKAKLDSGYQIIWSGPTYDTDFYTGEESTFGYTQGKLSPRRLSPETELYTVSYVWRLGAGTDPRGPGPALGGTFFPRSRVAPTCPLVTVAKAEPYLAVNSPTEDDYFFSPSWDARLVAVDSVAVSEITRHPPHDSLGLYALNLVGLQQHVLLP
jgi:hypothetical protein